jgi:putative effector of murein hydrolase
MTDLGIIRRVGLAIGLALLAGGLAYGFRESDEAGAMAAIGGALVGFLITPFQKK